MLKKNIIIITDWPDMLELCNVAVEFTGIIMKILLVNSYSRSI